jgi:hypothetical protein
METRTHGHQHSLSHVESTSETRQLVRTNSAMSIEQPRDKRRALAIADLLNTADEEADVPSHPL